MWAISLSCNSIADSNNAPQNTVGIKDVSTAVTYLKSDRLSDRIRAAQALQHFHDRASVRPLYNALKRNQYAIMGGTEEQLRQVELDESIFIAIETITGLQLGDPKSFDQQHKSDAISKIEKWLNNQ
jgi:HEAT repeat protein